MEKLIGWLMEHSKKPWLWVSTILITSILVNTGWPLLAGLGVAIWGTVTYAAGAKVATDIFIQKLNKEKEKKK